MAFSYGFYNSLNGDRKYDSEDLSRMFDGIIYDGVIGAVGDTFAVKAGTGNTVNVSSGRAWFNHTWTYNDAPMPISCGSAAVLLDRYDVIVLEVNAASDVRKNSIKVVTGTEASIPAKPTMENTEFVRPVATNFQFFKIFCPCGAASCWGMPAPNPAGNEYGKFEFVSPKSGLPRNRTFA